MNMTIDDMIAQLLKEKTDEISRKEDREKSDLTAKIEDLKMTIETPTKETHGANGLSFRGRYAAPAVPRSRDCLFAMTAGCCANGASPVGSFNPCSTRTSRKS